jgi:CheY-like chemotaxis protein
MTHEHGVSASGSGGLAGTPILVVEDDPASAHVLRALLSGDGAEVRLARTAEEANALLRGFRPRLVVVDLVLPGTSGLLLARQLRSHPATAGAPIVAVTFLGASAEQAALEAGCSAFFAKPIDGSAFLDRIASLTTAQTDG